MRRLILTFLSLLILLSNSWAQVAYKKANSKSADSLVNEFSTKRCDQLVSSIKKVNKKNRLDKRLIVFLNDFYNKDLTPLEINNQLRSRFKQIPWRFDQITKSSDLTKYEGRLRSYGNIEAFIGFVVQNDKVIAKRIYFRTRSHLDCSNPYNYLGLPDISYLQKSAIDIINFPLDFTQWYTFLFSDVTHDKSLSQETLKLVEVLLSKSSAK